MERRPKVTEQRAPSSLLEWPSRDVTRRSQLTIIAGPNGAGKSRLCPFYVSAKSFDGNSDYGHIVALHISKIQTHKVVDNPPQWFKEQFDELFEHL